MKTCLMKQNGECKMKTRLSFGVMVVALLLVPAAMADYVSESSITATHSSAHDGTYFSSNTVNRTDLYEDGGQTLCGSYYDRMWRSAIDGNPQNSSSGCVQGLWWIRYTFLPARRDVGLEW